MWLTTKSSDADKWLDRGMRWLEKAWDSTEEERVDMFRQFRYCARISNGGVPMDMLTGISATKVVDSMPNPPRIVHDMTFKGGAKFNYDEDTIHMVPPGVVDDEDWYHYVIFHELGHSTENSERLNYRLDYRTSQVKAEVEIGAELTAIYLAIQCEMKLSLNEALKYLRVQMASLRWWQRTDTLRAGAKLGERAASYILGG